MERLPPIPTPPSQRWREIRIKMMPFTVFLGALLATVIIWKDNVAPPTLLGEVEAVRACVSSPKSGILAQLNIVRLQEVKAGDHIGQVITTDPRILQSSLAIIQAEIHLLRLNLDPIISQQRVALAHDRLRLDWMDQRVQLATARVKLQLAESDLRRAESLFSEKIVSTSILEQAQTVKRQLESEVEERSRLVAEQERNLHAVKMDEFAEPNWQFSHEDVMQASIKVQEEKLRLTEAELSPITLVVPIDGTVSTIHHRSGEAIAAGVPIVTVTTATSDRIVGYLRQPFTFEPKLDMTVEVRARSYKRPVSEARIVGVGSQLEPITPTLLSPFSSRRVEVGLPILVSLPSSQKLLPGEIVDLVIRPDRN
jgi:multidrug resistance efflux pump